MPLILLFLDTLRPHVIQVPFPPSTPLNPFRLLTTALFLFSCVWRQSFVIEVSDLFFSLPLSSISDNWASFFSQQSPFALGEDSGQPSGDLDTCLHVNQTQLAQVTVCIFATACPESCGHTHDCEFLHGKDDDRALHLPRKNFNILPLAGLS